LNATAKLDANSFEEFKKPPRAYDRDSLLPGSLIETFGVPRLPNSGATAHRPAPSCSTITSHEIQTLAENMAASFRIQVYGRRGALTATPMRFCPKGEGHTLAGDSPSVAMGMSAQQSAWLCRFHHLTLHLAAFARFPARRRWTSAEADDIFLEGSKACSIVHGLANTRQKAAAYPGCELLTRQRNLTTIILVDVMLIDEITFSDELTCCDSTLPNDVAGLMSNSERVGVTTDERQAPKRRPRRGHYCYRVPGRRIQRRFLHDQFSNPRQGAGNTIAFGNSKYRVVRAVWSDRVTPQPP